MKYIFLLLISLKCFAYDQELADRLKEDLEHETNRRKAFKEFEEEKKKSQKEQNQGLALWLEEQEQWDLNREKSIGEYKKTRTPARPSVIDAQGQAQEVSQEYYDDVQEKQRSARVIEDGRKQHIEIKNKILSQFSPQLEVSEEEELGIYNNRPRYDLRKRGKNKWSGKQGSSFGGGSSSGGSSGGFNSGGFQNNDFNDFPPPPPPDFNAVPQDSFEDFPPPPPPATDFGNAPGTFDSGFGDAPIPPPPPPPPPEGGWDF